MSKIEWCDKTWNPVRGCSRVSEGCRNCYAERMAARFSTHAKQEGDEPAGVFAGFAKMTTAGPRWTGRVELIPSKLDAPLRWRKPRKVFVNSMSDLFHEALPEPDVFRVLDVCVQAVMQRGHTMQILTKRPNRMADLVRRYVDEGGLCGAGAFCRQQHGSGAHHSLPPGIWLGGSCEDQATADERIPLLLQTPAAVRFVSLEPMLGPVLLKRSVDVTRDGVKEGEIAVDHLSGLHWVIVGGESGPKARPCDVAWIRSVVRQCREASVPVFVKQWGSRPYDSDYRIGVFAEHDRRTPRKPDGAGGTMAAGNLILLRDRKGGDPAEWGSEDWPREFPQ